MILGRVDGFDPDKAESERDERTVIPRCLLATQSDALESFELADCLLDTGAAFERTFGKKVGMALVLIDTGLPDIFYVDVQRRGLILNRSPCRRARRAD